MRARLHLPHVLRRPDQGWSSLVLLLAMLVLLGISIANAREASLTLAEDAASIAASLPVLMVAGGLIGFLLARSHIGVVRAHIIGAAVAAALLLFTAGESLLQAGVVAPETALSERVGAVWVRLEEGVTRYMERELNTPVVVTYLVFGALCWTTAQFGAFSVFRYDRGGPAVIAIGTVLFLNVGLGSFATEEELLPVLPMLALFSALAMLLLMRMQLVTQRLQWARRHISDTGEVSRLFLRSGVIFVALTVAGATSLTAVATVEAQKVSLGDLEEPLKDFGDEIARALGLVGVPPPDEAPVARGDYSAIDPKWTPASGTAFSAIVQSGRLRGNYWWGYARDAYTPGQGWTSTARPPYDRDAGQDIFVPDESTAGGSHGVETIIIIGDVARASLTAHALAEAGVFIDRAVTVTSDDDGQGIGVIEFQEPVEPEDEVHVTSFVRDYRDDATSLTANMLRHADGAYPDWIDQYLDVADGAVGPNVRAFTDEIRARETTAYGQALAVQEALRIMDYETDMTGICDDYEGSVPECVLGEQQGFCQHYATTMAIVLRELGIPSRFITGYLPGELDPSTGILTVDGSALHNWVEAYFPGFGWVRFDPTPGRMDEGQAPTAFPDGPEVPESPAPTAAPGEELQPTLEPTLEPTPFIGPAGPTESGGDGTPTAVIIGAGAILALLLTVVSVLLLFRLRRLPEGDEGVAYRGIVSLATRLGYGPHPSQTEYEYAGTLSEAMPNVRDELFVVADARVETAYGQRHLDTERRGLLRQAYARIRTALLRLSLRRKRQGRS